MKDYKISLGPFNIKDTPWVTARGRYKPSDEDKDKMAEQGIFLDDLIPNKTGWTSVYHVKPIKREEDE